RLVTGGANVVALVRDFVPSAHMFSSGIFRRIKMVHGGLEDYSLLRRIMSDYEAQNVFHFAAQSQVLTALENPRSTFEANIAGTWNILEAARNSKTIESVVCSSSDKAYGISDKLPYTEDMALKGEFPYEVSKSCADLIAHAYFKTYSLPVSIARCGNTYGGGDLNFKRLIPKVIKYALHEKPLVMRSDGLPKRDFVYIDDIIEAYLMLSASTQNAGVKGEAFNFSSGEAKRVKDVVELLLKQMNSKITPQWVTPAEHEIPEQYLSISKAKKALKWEPKFKLSEGLELTVAWYKHFFEHPAQFG
ncbi:MAG: GDP-mannose 4,6-dehydratase, partial [Candidatus Micrarchaeota archaeon]